MSISKRLFIYIALGVVLAGSGVLFWKLYLGGTDNTAKSITTCGLSSESGETLSIRQGTTGRVGGISIGVGSVENGKANLQFWDAEANLEGPTLTLGPCESADFGNYTIYVLSVKSWPENPFGGSGTGNDSVNVFVEKP